MAEPAGELPPLPLRSAADPAPEAEPEPVAEPAAPVGVIFRNFSLLSMAYF